MGLLQRIKGRLVRVKGRLVRSASPDDPCCCDTADCIPDPDAGKIDACDCGPDCDPAARFPQYLTLQFQFILSGTGTCAQMNGNVSGDPVPFTNLFISNYPLLLPLTSAGRIIRVCKFKSGLDSSGNNRSFYRCSQRLPRIGAESGAIAWQADAGHEANPDGCTADHGVQVDPQPQLWRHTLVQVTDHGSFRNFTTVILISPESTIDTRVVGAEDVFDLRQGVSIWFSDTAVGGVDSDGRFLYQGYTFGGSLTQVDRVTILTCDRGADLTACAICPGGYCLRVTQTPFNCLDNDYPVTAVGVVSGGPPTCEWISVGTAEGDTPHARVFFNGENWQADIVDLCGNCGPVEQTITFIAPVTRDGCPPLTCWVFDPDLSTVKIDQGGNTLIPKLAVNPPGGCVPKTCPSSCTSCPECIKARVVLSGSLGIDGDTETHRTGCEWSGSSGGRSVTIDCCDGKWRVTVVGGGATLVFERQIDSSMLFGCPVQTRIDTGAILPTSYFFVPGASTLPAGYTGNPQLALVDCADIPTCPTNCDACCTNYLATIAGSTANDNESLISLSDTCHWFVDAIGPGADATLDIECIAGTWTATYTRAGQHYTWIRLASATSCPPTSGWFLSENTIDGTTPTLTLECACPTDCSACCGTYTFTFLCNGLTTDYTAYEDGSCGYDDLGGGFNMRCYKDDAVLPDGWNVIANLGSAGGSYFWNAPPSSCPPTDPAAWTLHQSGPQPCPDLELIAIDVADCPMSEAEMEEAMFTMIE